MDRKLRVRLYNFLHDAITEHWDSDLDDLVGRPTGYGWTGARAIWCIFWGLPADEMSHHSQGFCQKLKAVVLGAPWNEIYDLLEFALSQPELAHLRVCQPGIVNAILEQEMSGYRFRAGLLVPVSDSTELAAIDEALEAGDRFAGARTHIVAALQRLSQKPKPDLRNAVKEAISAVESAARVVTGKHKASLGDLLPDLESARRLHPALKGAWSKLYGYTSDEQGIRHAMIDEPNLDMATAKYMVVSCAAFVNLLVALPDRKL